jgi:N-acyl-D-aspartate/D-glutamate deacylase
MGNTLLLDPFTKHFSKFIQRSVTQARVVACALLLALNASAVSATSYDLVLAGGRVIDPETRLDAVRNVGISEGIVQVVTTEKLNGSEVLDVSGLIVAPGFIDLHSHASVTIAGQKYQARDGVTSALELEAGRYPVVSHLASLGGESIINYGVSASYLAIRGEIKGDLSKAFSETASDQEITKILKLVDRELKNGGIGIGLPLDYASSVITPGELQKIFEFAASRDAPIFVHIRRGETPGDVRGLNEVVDLATQTGAPIHICHINSNSLRGIASFLDIVRRAQSAGVDITAEAYPYTAGSTFIGAEAFDRDWQHTSGISYNDIEWALTGERFTKETWEDYRQKYRDDHSMMVIIHNNKEEFVEQSLRDPMVMIASDAMTMEEIDSRVHPRTMGSYARFLGRYVRERQLVSWMEAIRKTSLMPAQRLEGMVPAMKKKGRIQVGSHADIAVIDPETVIDKATFNKPNQFSDGIPHVLVGGQFVVKNNALVEEEVGHGKAVLSEHPQVN